MKLDECLIAKNQGVNTTTEKIKYARNGYKIVQAKNIDKYNNSFDCDNFIDELTYKNMHEIHKLNNGDVLFTNIGSQMGNACIYDKTDKAIITWNVLKLVPNHKFLCNEYLCIWLNMNSEKIRALNSSSTMPFVSGKTIGNLDINLPNISTQKKISSIVFAINKKIESNKHINKNLCCLLIAKFILFVIFVIINLYISIIINVDKLIKNIMVIVSFYTRYIKKSHCLSVAFNI